MGLRRVTTVVVAAGLLAAWLGQLVARSGPPGWAWLLFTLTAGLLGAGALFAYYRHKDLELRAKYLIDEGWVRTPRFRIRDEWTCPRCGTPLHSWAAIRAHCNEDTSPCARYRQHLEDTAGRPATLPMAGYAASFEGKGGADTFTDPAGVDGGRQAVEGP